jgi:hypothetical protein
MNWLKQAAINTGWLMLAGYALICWCARQQESGR